MDNHDTTTETKKIKKSFARHFDDALLTYSSTKLGLTDYDKNKDYDREEKKLGMKGIGLIIAIMFGFIAFATILVEFVLT